MRTARASSRPAPVFHGRITPEGAFELVEDERAKRRDYFTTLAGCDVDIRVTKHKDTRSERANAYYWACVLTPMSDDGSAGDQSPEDIHDAMCEKFLPKEHKRVEFFNRMTG